MTAGEIPRVETFKWRWQYVTSCSNILYKAKHYFNPAESEMIQKTIEA